MLFNWIGEWNYVYDWEEINVFFDGGENIGFIDFFIKVWGEIYSFRFWYCVMNGDL